METVRLGKTGLWVSRVGFGGIPIQRLSEADAVRVVLRCLDLGVTFLDTALAYGDGKSEQAMRDALAERGGRDEVVIATKIPPKDWVWPGKAETRLRDVFPGDWIEECVERQAMNS